MSKHSKHEKLEATDPKAKDGYLRWAMLPNWTKWFH